jgi:AraC family ethanolamine operon transcriptional activator
MQNSQPAGTAGQIFSGVIRRDAVEDMSAAVRQFFDLNAVQLEPGSFRCQIDFIAAGNTFLYREHYPVHTHLTGELLSNRFGFALPVQGPSLKFAGEQMERSRLASAMTGEEMDVYAAGGLKQFVVLLDHARLLQLAEEAALPADVQRALRRGRETMPLVAKPQAVASFSQRLQHLLRLAAVGELQVDAERFEEWVYGQTLSILDVKDLPAGRPPGAVLVRRAIEIADAQRGPVPVATLCRLLRVSPGTLENAFKTITGVTPHAFFLRRRLNHARSLLLREDPLRRKVTDIATELGFSELGRFAVRYRQMFGETPSETLKRPAATVVAGSSGRAATSK